MWLVVVQHPNFCYKVWFKWDIIELCSSIQLKGIAAACITVLLFIFLETDEHNLCSSQYEKVSSYSATLSLLACKVPSLLS